MFQYSDKLIEALFRGVYTGKITPRFLPQSLYYAIADYLKKGIYDGYGATFSALKQAKIPNGFTTGDLELLTEMRLNIYLFSAAKTYQEIRTMSDALIDDKGRTVPFKQFREKADETYQLYNKTWLQTEYDTAIGQAQSATQISIPLDYLLMRSLYRDIAITHDSAYQFYVKKALTNWSQQNLYGQAIAALLAHRNNQTPLAERILKSLAEQSMNDTYKGIYWKNRTTSRWYAMPVQHQGMMIDCFSEINAAMPKQPYKQFISGMLTWLIVNKEANHWGNSLSTTEAVYSIIANAGEWFSNKRAVQIKLGNTTTIGTATEKAMEGSGYFKKRIEGNKVNASMGNITVTTATQHMVSNQPSYGSIYWQYLANMDDITASKGDIEINKTIEVFRDNKWIALNENEPVKVGELLNVTLSIKTDREMDYVHVKDLRPDVSTRCTVSQAVLIGIRSLQWFGKSP